MNNFNKGFTLIELLVVVLVIGALTSVALPQYERAVLRSRAAEVWTVLPTLRSATEEYCMETGDIMPRRWMNYRLRFRPMKGNSISIWILAIP